MPQIDPLAMGIAFGPLAMYLLVLGIINLSQRPFLTTGGRDSTALAVALSGLVLMGPCNLFMPPAAAVRFGAYCWFPMIALYLFACTLLVLYQRPRLTVYNITPIQLKPAVSAAALSVDDQATWAGTHLVLPKVGLQLDVENFLTMRNVSLVASGDMVPLDALREFELALEKQLAEVKVGVNPRGVTFAMMGVLLGVMLTWNLASDPQSLARHLYDFLRIEPPV